ncbi:ester cyclase [Halodesulfurarchaeum sp.]|uniref:ester cyclase n=1 Tax=Halodesulfurarchaeum sp. TaxID=1980530 RepID=UPI002FC2CEF0
MTQASSSEYEQAFNDYEDLWNGDLSKMDIVSESVTVYTPAHPEGAAQGHEGFEEYLQQVHEAFPDYETTKDPVAILVSEDTIMHEWTKTGTFKSAFYGTPPTGRSMNLSGMSKIIMVDGKIQEDYIYLNEKKMFEQLGLTFPDIVSLTPKLVWGKVRNAL